MGKSAYIQLVEHSVQKTLSLEDVKKELHRYIQMAEGTGKQLGWEYAKAAFPYTMETKTTHGSPWILLKGKKTEGYKYLCIGVNTGSITKENSFPHIQVTIPDGATHGDHAKANEFCRHLAKAFQAKLYLFNRRIMYFYPRKI
ncbi:DUF1885 family protein [Melghirimyces algeriensis]|uniref:DUF1885 family protein n=1 Tax=Melghirimyces algeriensis TaxID=910412 RepID=A0A521BPL3_9BACL|nr:DUF1885 family protein [Melghirimyces algeriensis]SMO49102.1 protein of unknown function [Melghirimyces algeriensis]